MLSLGAAAFLESGEMVGTFETNFETLEGASGHPETMAWWAKQKPEIWAACRKDPANPKKAMESFESWITKTAGDSSAKPVCVAYPAGFDFTYVHWYFMKFLGRNPFSFACIDMKTYAMSVLNKRFRDTTKNAMPKAWFEALPPHTHRAIDDALEQGYLFMKMRAHRSNL